MSTYSITDALAAADLANLANEITPMGHKVDGKRYATVVEKVAAGALTITGVRQCAEMGTL